MPRLFGGFRRWWSDLPLRGKGLAVIALPLVALVAASLSFWVSQQKNHRAQQAVARSQAVETQLGIVLSQVVDAETGVRGWLITGQERFLEPYESARRRLPLALRRLDALVQDNPRQSLQVRRLRPMVETRLALAGELRRRPAMGTAAAPEMVALLDTPRAQTERIRAAIAAMEDTEDALLVQRRREAQRARDQAVVALLGALAVGLGGGLSGMLLFTHGVSSRIGEVEEGAQRLARGAQFEDPPPGNDEVGRLGQSLRSTGRLLRERELALHEREAHLQAVFDSSPDIIAAFGPDGTLRSASPAIQEVLGYHPSQLADLSVDEVIHPEDHRLFRAGIAALVHGTQSELSAALQVRHADGRWLEVEVKGRPLLDAEGRPIGALVVARDVTERSALEWAHHQAREAAEAASRSKSEFLSRMSHELRTPLNAILGFGQVLQLEDLTDSERDSADHIVKAGCHLLDLINEVLDISRIETGQLTLSLEPVDVGEVAKETLDLVRPLANHRRLKFPSGPPAGCSSFVRADRQRLKQVLVNLLANAVKYNRNNGEIALGCVPGAEGRLRIAITDTGPGIPPEKIEIMFRPFERLDAEKSDIEGTGLGLALAQRLVEAMSGTLGVDSEVGTGSTFWVELAEADAPTEALAAGAPAGPVTEEVSRRPKTLLYIEDNAANVKLVERILDRRPEVELLVAMEGELGVELAAVHRPDLILLDLNLPDISGEVVLHRIRAEPASRDIPVVVVSADAMPRQIAQLRASGVSHYLTKPFLVSEFLSVVDTAGAGAAPSGYQAASASASLSASLSAAVATEPFEDLLDPLVIDSLRELGDEPGTLAELRSTFADTGRATLDELQEAVEGGDGGAVRALAHRLKGSSGSMGAQRLARMCQDLENQVDAEADLAPAAATVARLRWELDAAVVALAEALP